MYHILIRGRNCAKYIHDCLESVKNQSHTDWRAHVVLDAPEDNSWEQARCCAGLGIHLHLNKKRKGLCHNMYYGINLITAQPDDVICVLDADDTMHYHALKVIHKVYKAHPDCLATYGSYIKRSKGRRTRVSREYPPDAIVRNHRWQMSHMKSFKAKLVPHIPASYFQGTDGTWGEAASDLALMFCVAELAGLDRCYHVSKEIYFWNDSYSGSTKASLQKVWDGIFRTKKPLRRI